MQVLIKHLKSKLNLRRDWDPEKQILCSNWTAAAFNPSAVSSVLANAEEREESGLHK